MLDLHTHILPCIDDGSRSVDESVSMLRREVGQGIGSVVLTPHFYANRESPDSFLKRRDAAIGLLRGGLGSVGVLPDMYAGAEVAYYDGISHTEDVELLCIGCSNAMLVEMPFCRWSQRMINELFDLQRQRGIQPILAHVERYIGFQERDTVSQLCDCGIWMQANASFFLRWQTSHRAMQMLKRREIHFLGSDCHNMTHRPPNLGDAAARIKRKLGQESMGFLDGMENKLLEGAR